MTNETSEKNGRVKNSISDLEEDFAASEIKITAPWDKEKRVPTQGSILLGSFENKEIQKHFLSTRSRVHLMWIVETEKTKRITLGISALLFIVSALLVVFAPDGKEVITYAIAGAMIFLASGVAGYGFFKFKKNDFSVEAGKESIE